MKAWWSFLNLYRQHKQGFFVTLFLAVLTVFAGMALLGTSGWFLTASALTLAGLAFNFFAPSSMVRGFSILRIVSRYAERVIGHRFTLALQVVLRGKIFAHLMQLSPKQLAQYRHGDLIARLTHDVDVLDTVFLFIIAPVVTALCAGVVLALILFNWLPWAAALLMIAVVLASLVLPWLIARKATNAGKQVQLSTSQLRSVMHESWSGHTDLYALNATTVYKHKWDLACQQSAQAKQAQDLYAVKGQLLLQLTTAFTVLGVLVLGMIAVQKNLLTGPVWVGLLLATLGFFEVFVPLMRGAAKFGTADKAVHALHSLLATQNVIHDPADVRLLPEQGALVCQGVWYQYDANYGTEQYALSDLNLLVPVGQRIVIQGESGAGKSSLLHLLLRFDDPQKGGVYYANCDLRDTSQVQVHQRIALLSQDAPVFLGTIRTNLQIANPLATDEQLWQALAVAKLDLQGFEQGLDTWTGETGWTLSLGQARRLCLARVLLSVASFIVLDEPTAGLDSMTEQAFFADLIVATQGKSVVLVTHAIDLPPVFDAYYHLEQGRLKQQA